MSARKKKNQINLLPQEDFELTTLGRVLKWALTTFRYIVIFVELIVVGGFLSRFYFDVQISNLNDDIKQQSAAIAARSDFETSFRRTQQKLAVISSISDESNSVIPVLDALARDIPNDSQLVGLSKDKAKITIRIATLSEISALNFTNLLRTEPVFSDIAISRVESSDISSYTTYTIEGNLNYIK